MKVENAELCGRMARWVLRCVAGVICALSCYLFAVFFADLVSCCPYIYRNLFLKYDYSRVFAGAACDQGGLTKTAVIVFLLEAWTGFNWYMCRLVSKWRIWWFAHTFVFLLVFVFPILLSAWFTWELWRYILVMGITVDRAKAVLLAILFFFSPAFCDSVFLLSGVLCGQMDCRPDAADKELASGCDLPFRGACCRFRDQCCRTTLARQSSASDHLRTIRRFRASCAMIGLASPCAAVRGFGIISL